MQLYMNYTMLCKCQPIVQYCPPKCDLSHKRKGRRKWNLNELKQEGFPLLMRKKIFRQIIKDLIIYLFIFFTTISVLVSFISGYTLLETFHSLIINFIKISEI